MSRRDTYYFPHEYNAKDDPKCEQLIWELGMEGYGMFWALLEVLRAQPDYTYPVANIPIVAKKYNADMDKMRRVVFDFGLFSIVEERIFFSNGLTSRMRVLDERRKRLSEAGKKGMAERWRPRQNTPENSHVNNLDITPLLQPYNIKENKSKVNTKKLTNVSKESSADEPRNVAAKRGAFVAPTLEEVQEYVKMEGLTNVDTEVFVNHYTANGWKIGKACMKDWRAAVRKWSRTPIMTNAQTTRKDETDTRSRYTPLC